MNYRLHLLATTLVFLIVLSAWLVPHPASAQAGGISNLTIAADRPNYTGTCPTQVILTGKLQANQPFGVVRYQFVHSDGTASAVSQLNIDRKDAFTVEETLRKESSWNDTIYLRIFLPDSNFRSRGLEPNHDQGTASGSPRRTPSSVNLSRTGKWVLSRDVEWLHLQPSDSRAE